jgi:putative membrane-bound dehydrogenase-like protein
LVAPRIGFVLLAVVCCTLAPSLLPAQSRDAKDAVAGLDVAPGLEATLFAAEPTLLSPSDIDVDHLGRVWVCEVVNYRHRNGERPEGDRILILEDTNQDGVCDKSTIFYQGRDIDTALGICVLGNQVIVSVAPNVFVFTDEDGDGKADRKETLFTNVGDPQHDHSTHAFVFGPDGRFYWNVGNTGHRVCDRHGNPIIDMAGNEVNDSGRPYRQGMVFRCNPDGSEFQTLAWNFRNNYEVAVDSFGTIWQSDNDDDGNQGVRINYVMEYGNYGYVDEMTGAGWRTPRTNMEAEIPLQHWHLNDPGVVPNLLQTGAGSPTGICVYEGDLLPEVFRGQVIHCDAGPNVVRAYPVKDSGAGYAATMVNILHGARDQWFRPSDVCVAPDGSLFVADWYDPGVGGHRMGDVDKGRIYRVAPRGKKYAVPNYNFTTVAGAISALKSPNLAARYLAWNALSEMPGRTEPELLKLYKNDKNPRLRARALWLLSTFESGPATCKMALKDKDPNIRITALRALRALRGGVDLEFAVGQLVNDPSPQVRRECAIAIRELGTTRCPEFWAALAARYDGKDRWYLEALGIGAAKMWDLCLAAWRRLDPGMIRTKAGRDIVWRSRGTETPTMLMEFIQDASVPVDELPRFFRAFDFLTGPAKDEAVAELAFATPAGDDPRTAMILTEAIERLKPFDLSAHPERKKALERVLQLREGTPQFLTLVDRFNLADRYPKVLALAQERSGTQLSADAMRLLLAKDQTALVAGALDGTDDERVAATVRALGIAADGRAQPLLLGLVENDDRPDVVRQEAVRGLARTKPGAQLLIGLYDEQKLPESLHQTAAAALHAASFDDVKQEAIKRFPLPPSRNDKPLPPLAELLKAKGNVEAGKKVFATVGKCATCHIVGKEGKEVGPNLTEIGSKLSREALFESILFPSAGISHNYETWAVATKDGNVFTGVLTTQSPDSVSLKNAEGLVREIKRSDIDELKKQSVSLMPADLQKTMTAEELIDVIEYLQTLKKN